MAENGKADWRVWAVDLLTLALMAVLAYVWRTAETRHDTHEASMSAAVILMQSELARIGTKLGEDRTLTDTVSRLAAVERMTDDHSIGLTALSGYLARIEQRETEHDAARKDDIERLRARLKDTHR